MHELERLDEDPRKYANRLKPGHPHGSSDPKDYRFGLTEEEIQKYEELADLQNALTLLRYGSSKLYPYLMKRVDVFPQMLRELPFHSLFQGGTEGSERTHYLHQCLYFGHSAGGRGWKCQDPIITLFRRYYRLFRRRLAKCPATVQEAFNQYVKEMFEEAGLDHTEEMSTADNQPPFPDQTVNLSNRILFQSKQIVLHSHHLLLLLFSQHSQSRFLFEALKTLRFKKCVSKSKKFRERLKSINFHHNMCNNSLQFH